MASTLQTRLLRAFQLTHDLAAHLDEASLNCDLPGLPSNRISGQLWCVVGSRESYLRAIEAGGWQGFSCRLNAPHNKQDVLNALESTQRQWSEFDFIHLTEAQEELAFALLEHEVQHHGQLIRFVYGNGLTFPKSWNLRYRTYLKSQQSLLRMSLMKHSLISATLVRSLDSQFFHNRRHFSIQALDRSTTQR